MPATPVCGKCDNTSFEAVAFSPKRANHKLFSIQCVRCGVPIGVMEYYSVGALIENLAKKLNVSLDR